MGSCYQVAADETDTLSLHTEVLTKGMTRRITVQDDSYPADFSQFLFVVLGSGAVTLTLNKWGTEGDVVGFYGLGISAWGVLPFFRFGKPEVTFTENLYIGSKHFPLGLLWITSLIIMCFWIIF